MKTAVPKRLLLDPGHLLSFGFGSGLSPYAPGTVGTLAAIPFYLLLSLLNPVVYLLVTIACVFVGIFLCGRTSKALGVHDHGAIVWDEFAGFFITMLFVPANITTVVIGFCLFRLFDIIKPWPISVIDSRIHGGLGVMLDDVIAGVFALVVMQIAFRILW